MADFDYFANNYDSYLNKSLRISGESWFYFAKKRLEFSLKKLSIRHDSSLSFLDFGCGIGNLYSVTNDFFPNFHYTGIDSSKESILIANTKYKNNCFYTNYNFNYNNEFDLIFTNGVFHHIDHHKHSIYFKQIYNCLNSNATFIFWENNPLNFGTRFIMSQNPFDKDAHLLYHWDVTRSLQKIGFTKIKRYSYFYFPSFLKILRFSESFMSRFPFGAQYVVMASK